MIRVISQLLPKTMKTSRKCIDMPKDAVIEYAVCPDCNSIYKLADCFEIVNGKKCLTDRMCDYTEYPNHPHHSRRLKCNSHLMKKVNIGDAYKLVPQKVFQYHSIRHSLKLLIEKKGFMEKCNCWRKRTIPEHTYADIYDGKVWKSLNGEDRFLSAPYNTMNMDWFNPYKHTIYSTGAIYLAIQNLPRAERYKIENIILVGMIPGPREPEKDISCHVLRN